MRYKNTLNDLTVPCAILYYFVLGYSSTEPCFYRLLFCPLALFIQATLTMYEETNSANRVYTHKKTPNPQDNYVLDSAHNRQLGCKELSISIRYEAKL